MILDIVWLYVAAFAVALTLELIRLMLKGLALTVWVHVRPPVSQSLWTGRGRKNCCHGSIRAAIIAYVINIITGILYRNIYKNVGKITGVSYFERSANWIFWEGFSALSLWDW